ncbi:hypothetical protein [Enterobacter sp. 22325]|uniref:hypothetical protein n=1 Tax=Enterobacter sp. 22325 TaxID=3453911 RepID=UPI003F82A38A
MLTQSKRLCAMMLFVSCFCSNAAANLTIFDCLRGNTETSMEKRASDRVLNYDGVSRNRVTHQAIEKARIQRLWLNHLREFCSVQRANEHSDYVSLLQNYLPVRANFISSLYFATGSSRTADMNITSIRQAVKRAGNNVQLLIIGSADATGEVNANKILSSERARFVAGKVTGKNVSHTFIIPLGQNNAQSNQPQYRRADVYVLIPKS